MDVKAYTDIGLEAPGPVLMWERRFLHQVDLRKDPIERNVTLMVRLRAVDYNSPKQERKEYVYFMEEWVAHDVRGIEVAMREHYEGRYTKQFLRPHLNPQTGDAEYMEHDITKRQTIYTIPWSKKAVDDIIAKSVRTGKDSIKYCIKFFPEDSLAFGYNARRETRDYFSYEQFSSWDFTDVYNFHVAPLGQYWDKKRKQYKQIGVQTPIQQSHIT